MLSFFICIFRHHKKHRPSDIYYIRKAVPTIAKPCKSRALFTVCMVRVSTMKYANGKDDNNFLKNEDIDAGSVVLKQEDG